MSTLKLSMAFLLAFGATSATSPASAALLTVFDSRALGDPLCGVCFNQTRNASRNTSAVVEFSANVRIGQIGFWSSINGPQDIKFLIFDSRINGGGGDLLFSQTKSFATTPIGWVYTDLIDFMFESGKTYDMAIIGNTGSLTGRWIANQDLTSGPITELARNGAIYDFDAPSNDGGYAAVAPFIQLNAIVPEPASWAMMIIGFGLTGASLRFRRSGTMQHQPA
jgi:hypothetical protein